MEEIMDARAWEAIVSAAPYVAGGAAEAGKAAAEGAGQSFGAVQEAYRKLIGRIHEKAKDGGQAARAADELVADPDSEGRRAVLAEKLEASGVEGDPEVRAAAEELLDAVRAQPGGEGRVANVMTAVGRYIAQADRGGSASVTMNRPEGREG